MSTFLEAVYRLCLLSLARLGVGAVLTLAPDKFGTGDQLLINSLFIIGAVAVLFSLWLGEE